MDEEMKFFSALSFWSELEFPKQFVESKFYDYFGKECREIDNQEDSIEFLNNIISQIQEKMCKRISLENTIQTLIDLYKILDKCYGIYIREKRERRKIKKSNIQCGDIWDILDMNRNICKDIIDSTNIWIENYILLRNISCNEKINCNNLDHKLNCDLLCDIYIYGIVSRTLTLLTLNNKKFKDKPIFYGLKITPNEDIPIDAIKDHPIIYFNYLLIGNQDNLNVDYDSKEIDNTVCGRGFKDEFGIPFSHFSCVINYIQKVLHKREKEIMFVKKNYFIKIIKKLTKSSKLGSAILNNFALTKEKIIGQLNIDDNEKIVWKIGVNRYRNEICPFVLLDNERVITSYYSLKQSKELWMSYFQNGGMIYSNKKDKFTKALDKRNEELSDTLVNILRKKLSNKYTSTFNEKNVQYSRIYGERDIDYGDFDLIFYAQQVNELFLIESKYFSDSLNPSSMITDYDKLFERNGYYVKCRRRYDLVIREPEPLKKFIGVEGNLKVHFLFVSSKPLEIEFQDKDKVVTFLCLDIFENYLNGKLTLGDDESIVRPVYII